MYQFVNHSLALDILASRPDFGEADRALQAYCAERVDVDSPHRRKTERAAILKWWHDVREADEPGSLPFPPPPAPDEWPASHPPLGSSGSWVRIRGFWRDGHAASATAYHRNVDGEWFDDRFGQGFSLELGFIGRDKDPNVVADYTHYSFWDGVACVVYLNPSQWKP